MKESFNVKKNLRIYDVPLAGWMFKQRITKACEMNSNGIAIDIGCGRGHLTAEREETVGVDVLQYLNEVKKNNTNREFVKCSADYLPFRNNSFDCAFALNVFEHVQDCKKATEEVTRILKKDGNFVISLPNENCFYKVLAKIFRAAYGDPHDLHSYDCVRHVVNKEFDKIETHYAPSIPSFLKLWEISKYKPRKT